MQQKTNKIPQHARRKTCPSAQNAPRKHRNQNGKGKLIIQKLDFQHISSHNERRRHRNIRNLMAFVLLPQHSGKQQPIQNASLAFFRHKKTSQKRSARCFAAPFHAFQRVHGCFICSGRALAPQKTNPKFSSSFVHRQRPVR